MIPSSSIPNKVWIFRHERDESIMTNITDRGFKRERLIIDPSGKITVKCSFGNGYAWDGCTPKWNCLHFNWGTPDGKLDYTTGKPMTYYASMFHDALYQFKDEKDMCISRKETDVIFRLLMRRNRFMWSGLYYLAVRLFGGFCGKWTRKFSKYGIKVSECSWEEV
jgi:hypothetical protein